MRILHLADAALHDKAQRLRQEHGELLLALDAKLPEDERTCDASSIAADIVSACARGDRVELRALGIEIDGDGPVTDDDLAAALFAAGK